MKLTGHKRTEQLRESQAFRSAIFDLRRDERRFDADVERRRVAGALQQPKALQAVHVTIEIQ